MDNLEQLVLICPAPQRPCPRLAGVLDRVLAGVPVRRVSRAEELTHLAGHRLLFAWALDAGGVNLEGCRMLALLRAGGVDLTGCTGGVVVDGESELYTKAVGRQLVLAANGCGCLFVGGPLVEATGSLKNFAIRAKSAGTDLAGAYLENVQALLERVVHFCAPVQKAPRLVALHASSYKTSNTMALWQHTKNALGDRVAITEIGLRNGTLADCAGCPYTMCLHFGERGDCFYGGVMVQEVYPAFQEMDGVMLICPNYNDALSANLTACINRLTALFRSRKFYDKALYGIVVSGYSGSDLVAEQLLGALCMNKTFYLPPRFVLMETANDPGAALALPDIETRVEHFAADIAAQLTGQA